MRKTRYPTVRERLKELREYLNLTQKDFSQKLGIRQAQVARWEGGYSNVPNERILQICQTFGVCREWLETGRGEIFNRETIITVDDQRAIIKNFFLNVWARLLSDQREFIRDLIKELDADLSAPKPTDIDVNV